MLGVTVVGSPVTSHAPFRACRIRAFRVGHVFLVKVEFSLLLDIFSRNSRN